MDVELPPSRREGFLRALLGAVADTPLYVYDRELRVVEYFWGRGESPWGLVPSSLLGRTLVEVLGAEQAAPFDRVIREVFATGQSRRVEISFLLPSGRSWFDSTVAPIRGDDREPEPKLGQPDRGVVEVHPEEVAPEHLAAESRPMPVMRGRRSESFQRAEQERAGAHRGIEYSQRPHHSP